MFTSSFLRLPRVPSHHPCDVSQGWFGVSGPVLNEINYRRGGSGRSLPTRHQRGSLCTTILDLAHMCSPLPPALSQPRPASVTRHPLPRWGSLALSGLGRKEASGDLGGGGGRGFWEARRPPTSLNKEGQTCGFLVWAEYFFTAGFNMVTAWFKNLFRTVHIHDDGMEPFLSLSTGLFLWSCVQTPHLMQMKSLDVFWLHLFYRGYIQWWRK